MKRKTLEAWAREMKSLGFKTSLYERTGPVEEPLLRIMLPPKGERKRQELAVGFLSASKGKELHHLNIIQIFSAGPFALDDTGRELLSPLLPYINNVQPLGHFSLGHDGQLFFRYNLATPLNPWNDPEAVKQLFLVIIELLDNQFPLIEDFCENKISKDEFVLHF